MGLIQAGAGGLRLGLCRLRRPCRLRSLCRLRGPCRLRSARLLLTLAGDLAPAGQLFARQVAVLLAQLASGLAVQIKALRGLAQRQQIAGAAGVAAKKRRQRRFAKHTRCAQVDIGLDAQLQRLGRAAKQRRKVLFQQVGAGGGADVLRAGNRRGAGRDRGVGCRARSGSHSVLRRRGCNAVGGHCVGRFRKVWGGVHGGRRCAALRIKPPLSALASPGSAADTAPANAAPRKPRVALAGAASRLAPSRQAGGFGVDLTVQASTGQVLTSRSGAVGKSSQKFAIEYGIHL